MYMCRWWNRSGRAADGRGAAGSVEVRGLAETERRLARLQHPESGAAGGQISANEKGA